MERTLERSSSMSGGSRLPRRRRSNDLPSQRGSSGSASQVSLPEVRQYFKQEVRQSATAEEEEEGDEADSTPALLTRASLERLKRERDTLREELRKLRAAVGSQEDAEAEFRAELAAAAAAHEAAEVGLRAELAAAAKARQEAESRVAELERELRDRRGLAGLCAKLEKENTRQATEECSSCEELRKQAAELQKQVTQALSQQKAAEGLAQNIIEKSQQFLVKAQMDAVARKLVVHVVSPAVTVDQGGVVLLRNEPSDGALRRVIMEEVLPSCTNVFAAWEDEMNPAPNGRDMKTYTADITKELVTGVRRHIAQALEARTRDKQLVAVPTS